MLLRFVTFPAVPHERFVKFAVAGRVHVFDVAHDRGAIAREADDGVAVRAVLFEHFAREAVGFELTSGFARHAKSAHAIAADAIANEVEVDEFEHFVTFRS